MNEESKPSSINHVAYVTVEFSCPKCGKFEVMKSLSTLTQLCTYCFREAKPIRIVSVVLKQDGEWIRGRLQSKEKNP